MSLGIHILAEFYDCPPQPLSDAAFIEKEMINAALAANATIVTSDFHHFSPLGVSGVVVIAESHLAIHTWPEFGYCAVDVFTCGETVDPQDALDYLVKSLGAGRYDYNKVRRGIMSEIKASSTQTNHQKDLLAVHD
jgi:S-adenosylmethionine decarboxylase proenzyme